MADILETMDAHSIREHAKTCAKRFKTNWIDLGRTLYTIWKDKSYRQWGYSSFDTYTTREIGIRKQTSIKLLRSYYFLEKEEPAYLRNEHLDPAAADTVPTYESVDVLRRAKQNKVLDAADYMHLKKAVLDKGKDAVNARKDLTALIRQRAELAPEEAWAQKKEVYVKRLISTLKSLKRETEELRVLPKSVLKNITDLIETLNRELG